MFLKFAIRAQIGTVACFVIALRGHHSIQTSFLAIVADVRMLRDSLVINFRSAIARLHLIIFRNFSFAVQIDIFLDQSEELKRLS